MVGGVRWVMWMAIGKLWQHMAQGIQEIEVRAGIQIGGGESASGMCNKNIAYTVFSVHLSQLILYGVSDIYHFIFSFCPDSYCSHVIDKTPFLMLPTKLLRHILYSKQM